MAGDPDDTECVNYKELRDMLTAMTDLFSKNQESTNTTLERVQRGMADVVDRVEALEARLPAVGATNVQQDGELAEEDDEPDEIPDLHRPPPRRQPPNRHGIGGGNINRPHPQHVRHDDPFAKVKFSIPPFYGNYDAEAYLDWEMTVEQKFSSHLVPEQHRVRQATSEFKDFAIIWWNELSTLRLQPDTWDRLKAAMRERFVPPSYQRDLRKKLQRLEQGDMSVQDYYAELQKGMIRAGVHEETEDKICRFYGGLRREIQDIVDYKEYNTVNRLFQLAILAEKELQGRQQRPRSSFTPRTPSTTPSRAAPPSTARSSTTPSASRATSTMTPPAPRV